MASRGLKSIQHNQNAGDASIFCRCPDLTKSKLEPLEWDKGIKCRRGNFDSTLKKLAELVADPVTSADTSRICSYLEDFFSLAGNEGFYVKDLECVMHVLEFLSREAKDVVEYQPHLEQMLRMCCTPPLLTRTSEGLFCAEVLEHYFTLLACLLVVLPTLSDILVVHEVIHRLLDRTKPGHIAAVKLEHCRRAVETSMLPLVLTEMLEIATDEAFLRMLKTTLLLVSVSQKCCFRMLETGMLEHILVRLDPNYVNRPRYLPPSEIPEEELGQDNPLETLLAVTNIMWEVLHSIMPPKKLQVDLNSVKPPSQFAMWSLRYAFKREVRCSGRNHSSVTMRNDLAAIMLASLATFSNWKFVESGLAEDFVTLAVATELGTDNTWASGVRLGTSNEDLRFKKILFLIVCHLAKIGSTIEIMKRRKLMKSALALVNPDTNEINLSKNETHFWILHQYALHVVAVLLPLMPEEFIKHRGTNRLLMILEWTMLNDFDSRLLLNCVKTINTIIMNGNEMIQNDFRVQGAIGTVIKIIHFVLSVSLLTTEHQRILTHAMMILETLIKDQRHYQTIHGEEGIKMVLRILQRLLYDKSGYFQSDNRLAIAVGMYIWECIVWCPLNLKTFVERGAVFLMLDVLEMTTFPVCIIYLGLLCDMFEDGRCETQLCTWRGENKELGLLSLLAKIWRTEEIRIGTKRTKDGCIDDIELPLMGRKQLLETFHAKRDHTTSPALSEMMGSCLPKIYGIRKILQKNSAAYELAKNHYKILMQEIPSEDSITMLIIDNYFRLKQGEVWVEIQQEIQKIGILPLRLDGEMIFLMLQSHRRRSQSIQTSQEAILKAAKEAEVKEEKAVYQKIIDSTLAPTLDALHEVDYIARTTDAKFLRQSKQRQRAEVERALNFPKNAEPKSCHRTFIGNTNVTAIMDHQHFLQSVPNALVEPDKYKMMPAAPLTSSLTTSSLTSTENTEAPFSCRSCFITGIPCFHHKSHRGLE